MSAAPAALVAADREQLARVVALVREALGPDLLGAYLFGSAAAGGPKPRSDLDVLAVARRALGPKERRQLVAGLLGISGRTTARGRLRHVELTLVLQAEVRPWRYPPRFDLQYGDWWRDEFERGELEPWPSRESSDLAALLALALLADTPLHGPPPAALLDPVPPDDVRRAALDGLEPLVADLGPDTRNVVLTLARSWSTMATGELRSKNAAAEWALARLPGEHRPVLARARAVYLGSEEERWDDLRERIHPWATHVAGQIRALAATPVE